MLLVNMETDLIFPIILRKIQDLRFYGNLKKPEVTILSSLIQIVLFQKSIYQQLMQL
jgi:hypothetical protein